MSVEVGTKRFNFIFEHGGANYHFKAIIKKKDNWVLQGFVNNINFAIIHRPLTVKENPVKIDLSSHHVIALFPFNILKKLTFSAKSLIALKPITAISECEMKATEFVYHLEGTPFASKIVSPQKTGHNLGITKWNVITQIFVDLIKNLDEGKKVQEQGSNFIKGLIALYDVVIKPLPSNTASTTTAQTVLDFFSAQNGAAAPSSNTPLETSPLTPTHNLPAVTSATASKASDSKIDK